MCKSPRALAGGVTLAAFEAANLGGLGECKGVDSLRFARPCCAVRSTALFEKTRRQWSRPTRHICGGVHSRPVTAAWGPGRAAVSLVRCA